MRLRVELMMVGLLVTIFASGCGQYVRPLTRMQIGTERVFDRNYEIGQKKFAYVGQPIVKVKDYQVNRFSTNFMQASDDFVIISDEKNVFNGRKNTDFLVRGETELDGEVYRLVSLPIKGGEGYNYAVSKGIIKNGFSALVKSDGSIHSKLMLDDVIMKSSVKISPSDVRLTPTSDEEIELDPGYLNYELIYAGTDGKLITMTYREYTPDNLARPAFFQNLVYEAGKSEIRFRDTAIQIHEATNEKIVYTVLSDGLGG